MQASASSSKSRVLPHPTGSLEPFIVPAMTALQKLNPNHRPSTMEKLAKWFERSSYCSVRENVPLTLLIPEVMKIIGAGPITTALATIAGDAVEGEAVSSQVVAEAALQCVSRLKRQTDFLKWPLDRRGKWMQAEGYAKFTIEPQMLAAELERIDAVKVGAQKLTYNEEVLKSSVRIDLCKSIALPKAAAAMCKTFSVSDLAPGLRAFMTKGELKGVMEWLKILGCRLSATDKESTFQVTVTAGSARHSTSVASAEELERQVLKELPEVLQCIFGNPRSEKTTSLGLINLTTKVSHEMKGFVIGKDGTDIRNLELQYNARLTYIHGYPDGKFVGWVSPSLLPTDGTAESLRGLATRLKEHVHKAEAAINPHIRHVLEEVAKNDKIFEAQKKDNEREFHAQRAAMARSPLQEVGDVGAAQLDRDHARLRDARKKAQRKEALAAKQSRQWNKRRDHLEPQRGGRAKAGEGQVGREDRIDAGQDGRGVAEDLRPHWEDPVGAAAFQSQLDAPRIPSVPGSKPRHRGHTPGDLRGALKPNEREGFGKDSPAEEGEA